MKHRTKKGWMFFLAVIVCISMLSGTVLADDEFTDISEETAGDVVSAPEDETEETECERVETNLIFEEEEETECGLSDRELSSEEEETGEDVSDYDKEIPYGDLANEINTLDISTETEEVKSGKEKNDAGAKPLALAYGDPIYLDGTKPDGGDGSLDNPVNTFSEAKDLAVQNGTSTIYVCGTVTYSDGDSTLDGRVDGGENLTLMRYEENPSDVLILVDGGTVTLTNITIDDNFITETEPMVKVDGADAVLNITDGTVIQNAIEIDKYIASGDHGAVTLQSGTLNMTGGCITNNSGGHEGGGVGVSAKMESGDEAVFNLSGGTISYNSAENGGGISLFGNVTFNMTGGTITKNTASVAGGGIIVDQYATAIISGGDITYNEQTRSLNWGGGGIYVGTDSSDPEKAGKLYIYNAEIAYNSALNDPQDGYTVHRASVACCETGELWVHLTDGEVFHDNYDANTVTVFRGSNSAVFDLSPVMLGGYPYHWTDGNGDELPLGQLIINDLGWFHARTAVSVNDETVSGLDRCNVHICYNQAYGIGSAIATNGNVQIGHNDGDVSISIEKHWTDMDLLEGVNIPDEVTVVVYTIDAKGHKTFVGYEFLTAEEGWKKTIENLPKYDSDGKEYEYIVEESEESIHGWFSMVTGGEIACSGHDDYYHDADKTAEFAFTVTNTPVEMLELAKTVEGPADTEEFMFKVTLYEPGDTDKDGKVNYYPFEGEISVSYDIGGEISEETLTFAEGAAFVTLPADGSAQLAIGDGMQWRIEEITKGADATIYIVDDGESEEGTCAEGSIGTEDVMITFVNTYEAEPKISKEIAKDDYGRKEEDGGRTEDMHEGEDTGGAGESGKTGDPYHSTYWIVVLCAAGACIAFLAVYRRQKKNENHT